MSVTPPDALLFITPVCPHCPGVLQGLTELVKQGGVGKLTVVNAAVHPRQAEEYGVRTVPWLRLGLFTLTGALNLDELRLWADWASGEEGIAHYVEHLLREGSYPQAVAFIAADTDRLKPLLAVVADPAANMTTRLGVSALLEGYADTPALCKLLPELAALSRHDDHRVRADACHFLGLSGSADALPHVTERLQDEHEEVREIAEDALEKLKAAEPEK